MGALRFTVFLGLVTGIVGGLTFIFIGLSNSLGWPEAYGFHCRRKCVVANLWHSPKLLAGGSMNELALFALLWSPLIITLALALPTLMKRWIKRRQDRIRPMN